MALREVRQQLEGFAEEAWTHYHELVLRWIPDA
jgi:hypothetical protein